MGHFWMGLKYTTTKFYLKEGALMFKDCKWIFVFRFRNELQNNDIAFHVHHLAENIPQEYANHFCKIRVVLPTNPAWC